MDQNLEAGENCDEITGDRPREARAVVVLWSSRSARSRRVRAGATTGARKNMRVAPVIGGCDRRVMFELNKAASRRAVYAFSAFTSGWPGADAGSTAAAALPDRI